MAGHCSISRRCLWLAVPIVGGHLGCLALPAATLAIGAPALMPICGEAPGRGVSVERPFRLKWPNEPKHTLP